MRSHVDAASMASSGSSSLWARRPASDGALHLTPRRWYDDQLRQNEVVLGGTVVLRYPSVVVRDEPHLVIAQLRRILVPRGS